MPGPRQRAAGPCDTFALSEGFVPQLEAVGIKICLLTSLSSQCFSAELSCAQPLVYLGIDPTEGGAVLLRLDVPKGPGNFVCAVKFQRRCASSLRVMRLPGRTTVRVPNLRLLDHLQPLGPRLWQATERFYWLGGARNELQLLEMDRSPCYCMFPSGKVVFAPGEQPAWSWELHLGRPGERGDCFMTRECVHREGLLGHKPLRQQFEEAGFAPFGATRHLFHHPKSTPPLFLVHPTKESRTFFFLRPPPRFWLPSQLRVHCIEMKPDIVLHVSGLGLPFDCAVEAKGDLGPTLRRVDYAVWRPADHHRVGGDLRAAVYVWLLCNARQCNPVAFDLLRITLEYMLLVREPKDSAGRLLSKRPRRPPLHQPR
eukprot:GGOE01061728.1.p1 GENE.GGOE01061728.1~~GGOE01061728.1.p1  ORF type:complete len:390 (-),score=88.99 GGOE01061728.1:241-1350(-)